MPGFAQDNCHTLAIEPGIVKFPSSPLHGFGIGIYRINLQLCPAGKLESKIAFPTIEIKAVTLGDLAPPNDLIGRPGKIIRLPRSVIATFSRGFGRFMNFRLAIAFAKTVDRPQFIADIQPAVRHSHRHGVAFDRYAGHRFAGS